MKIKEITNQTEWTNFFNLCGSPSFHQAWEWGEVQKKQHYHILRLGLYQESQLKALALVVKIRSKRGNFLFIPHGPVFLSHDPMQLFEQHRVFLTYLKELAQHEGFWFIRIAPGLIDTEENRKIFQQLTCRTAPIYMHAESMWALNLEKSEEELLAGMRKTTRYLIRKAEKESIAIDQLTTVEAMDEFWRIYEATYTREHFVPYSKDYITHEYTEFHKTGNALFFLGKIPPAKFDQEGQGKYVAGSLVIFTQAKAFYHQGASIHSKHPVPYLLQWEAIKEAKRRGCKEYNFYGIYHPGRTPSAWKGLTLFKQGFGGYQLNYVPTQDYILSPKYFVSYGIDKFLAWRRGI